MEEPHGPPVPDTAALARHLGLSRWAVSRALNDQPGVSEGTRSRVRDAAAATGFEPSAHGRGLRGAGPVTVGLLVPAFCDPAWMALAGGLCEGLTLRGLEPDWAARGGGEEPAAQARAWARLAARRAVAVLALGARSVPASDAVAAAPGWWELRRRGVPVIFVEPTWTEEPDEFPVVRGDFRAAAALVMAHLHGAGHRRIGLRGFHGAEVQGRAHWLRAAAEARGMTCELADDLSAAITAGVASGFKGTRPSPPQSVFRPTGPDANQVASPPAGRSRRGRALPARDVPAATALVAADDLTALRLLCEHRAAGRSLPRDGSVIGYGNDPAGALSAPALTTVDPRRDELVVRTLELLDDLMRDPANTRAGHVWIAPLLRCRGSVANVLPAVEGS